MSTPSDEDPPYKPPQWQQPEQSPQEPQSGGWQSSWQQPQQGDPLRPDESQKQGDWQSSWQQPQQQPGQQQGGWQSQWQQPPEQQPNQWQTQQTPQWGGYQPTPPTPGNAIASLILGIVSIVLCPIIPGVIGLVLGYGAKREIDASGGRLGGRGVALGGIITSWIGLALWGLVIALWVVAIVASS